MDRRIRSIAILRGGTEGNSYVQPLKGSTDHHHYLFGLLSDHEHLPLSRYWFYKTQQGQTNEPFNYTCYKQPPVLDANLVANFLHCFAVQKLAIQHTDDEMTEVIFDRRGFITTLRTKTGR